MPNLCPPTESLAAALRRRQPGGEEAELAAHLADCPACQAQLETLAGGSGWLERKNTTRVPPASPSLREAMAALESSAGQSDSERRPANLDFLQPSNQPGMLGKFGPYEIIGHVASGGMGIVLKARDPGLDRVVALKILPPALAANSLSRARFVREGRAAAAVVDEHVVPIYAVDECEGLPYIVMQFVKGRALSERIRASGPLRLEEILRIGMQTAAGLAAAHAQGLTHRDVKPSNILLENSVERVKLTDFGLARAADDAGLTRTGELAGTPEFMAPEQASNEAVDHRADLFSFGSVLYMMCTGVSPFQGASVAAAIRNVCDKQPPPVREINTAVPRWFSDIVARLMAKAPAERFQSAEEVRELLQRYLSRVQNGELDEIPGRATPWTPRARGTAIGATAVLAIIAALFFPLKDRSSQGTRTASSVPVSAPFVVRSKEGASMGGFARIEDALMTAPAGGVIELCWTGPREMNPVTLPPKPLTLRAGLGFQPVWSSLNSASALSASAALILEGIRFDMTSLSPRGPLPIGGGPRRPRTLPSGIALLAITNGPLRITHCTFEAKPGIAMPQQAAIFLADVHACHLESTFLFALSGKAIVWHQSSGRNASAALLTVTNCIAHAFEVFWLDLRESPRARLEIIRSTFHGMATFCVPASLAATNLEVDARQNVFHTGSIILDARSPASPPLPQWLRWREQENLLRPPKGPDQGYTAGPGVSDGPARLEDWNRWWNQTGANSRVVQLTFASGASDLNPGPGNFGSQPDGFRITDGRVVEGPPLERDEWQRFGADAYKVGPGRSN